MEIKYLEFTDRAAGWHVEGTDFGHLDLLVGQAGAGKSRIVGALERVVGLAMDEFSDPGSMDWVMAFEHQGIQYRWDGRTEADETGDSMVVREGLSAQGKQLVERHEDDLRVGGKRLRTRHSPYASTLAQLADRKQLRPVVRALQHVVFVEPIPLIWQPFFQPIDIDDAWPATHLWPDPDTLGTRPAPLSDKESALLSRLLARTPGMGGITRLLRLFLLQETNIDGFFAIKRSFLELFPWVEDVHVFLYDEAEAPFVSALDDIESGPVLDLGIREHGRPDWISSFEMSSSMLRVLALLVDLHQAEAGCVIIIDDIEAYLGSDTLPLIMDLLLRRHDSQLILTSKYPSLLERIPVTTWKVVTREGLAVRVQPAVTIAGLDTSSREHALAHLFSHAAHGAVHEARSTTSGAHQGP